MSRAEKLAKSSEAQALLRGLLKGRRTRQSLVTCAASKGVSRHFVYGFLSSSVASGEVTATVSGGVHLYQLTSRFVGDTPEPGDVPNWLCPKALPPFIGRRVYYGAKLASEAACE